MKSKEYFEKINTCCQKIFTETIKDIEPFGKVHHVASCLFEFSEILTDFDERSMLNMVSIQIESSSINLAFGLYRQAFSALRLTLELGLATIYFSYNKLDHKEWLVGKNDIKWAQLIDEENGVLSTRFTNAFFPELSPEVERYNSKTRLVYRSLSEFVHGNSCTWNNNGSHIKKEDGLISHFFSFFNTVSDILLFCLTCRYLKCLSPSEIDKINFIFEELWHLEPVRMLMGSPTGA